jgi:predicted acetyltransferase
MNGPQLVSPDIRYRDSYAASLREGLHLEPAKEEDILLAEKDFAAYLKKRNDMSRKIVLPNGKLVKKLPQMDFWLVDGEKFLGMTSLRPQLNEYLSQRGGNIGYAVRKSERCKGYGALILKLVLPHARTAGLKKVLITCHDENTGSIKIIEGAGGVLQDKIAIEGLPIPERRYWIQL